MVPPVVMTSVSHASAISAPAEIARWLTKAIVRTGEFSSESRIATAASTRPPSVLMFSSTARRPRTLPASRMVRARNGASPRSIIAVDRRRRTQGTGRPAPRPSAARRPPHGDEEAGQDEAADRAAPHVSSYPHGTGGHDNSASESRRAARARSVRRTRAGGRRRRQCRRCRERWSAMACRDIAHRGRGGPRTSPPHQLGTRRA
jgi:hypothetical protein